jgi:hypothetical protein
MLSAMARIWSAVRDGYQDRQSFRTADQIRGFFPRAGLVSSGLADMTPWPGRMLAPAESPALRVLADIARSPAPRLEE